MRNRKDVSFLAKVSFCGLVVVFELGRKLLTKSYIFFGKKNSTLNQDDSEINRINPSDLTLLVLNIVKYFPSEI